MDRAVQEHEALGPIDLTLPDDEQILVLTGRARMGATEAEARTVLAGLYVVVEAEPLPGEPLPARCERRTSATRKRSAATKDRAGARATAR